MSRVLPTDDDAAAISIFTTQSNVNESQTFSYDERFSLFSTLSMRRESTYEKVIPVESKEFKKGYEDFCTGSAYIGEWNHFGFCGQGTFIYPHGVEYEGHFNKIGQFHGPGTLTYPNGQKIHGYFKNGKLLEHSYVFNCGEGLDENFAYCAMPDRRFHWEIQQYFGVTGQEYIAPNQQTLKLPKRCYDTVDGIYDPKYKIIYMEEGEIRELRRLPEEFTVDGKVIYEIPSTKKIKWIEKHCRKGWDEPTGYQPSLYENWTAGRRYESEINECEKIPPSEIHVIEKPKQKQKLYSFIRKVHNPSTYAPRHLLPVTVSIT